MPDGSHLGDGQLVLTHMRGSTPHMVDDSGNYSKVSWQQLPYMLKPCVLCHCISAVTGVPRRSLPRRMLLFVAGCISVETLPCDVPRRSLPRRLVVVPFHTTYMDDGGKNTRHHDGTVAVCENLEFLDVVGCFYHWLCHIVRKMLKMGR